MGSGVTSKVCDRTAELPSAMLLAVRSHPDDGETTFLAYAISKNNIGAGFNVGGVSMTNEVCDCAVDAGLVELCAASLPAHSNSESTDLQVCMAAVSLLRGIVSPTQLDASAASEAAKIRACVAIEPISAVIRDCMKSARAPLVAPYIIEACLFLEAMCRGPDSASRRPLAISAAQELVTEAMRKHFGRGYDGSGLGMQQCGLIALRAMMPDPEEDDTPHRTPRERRRTGRRMASATRPTDSRRKRSTSSVRALEIDSPPTRFRGAASPWKGLRSSAEQ